MQYFSIFQHAEQYIRCPGSKRDSDDHRWDPPRLCSGNLAALEGAVLVFCVVQMVRFFGVPMLLFSDVHMVKFSIIQNLIVSVVHMLMFCVVLMVKDKCQIGRVD